MSKEIAIENLLKPSEVIWEQYIVDGKTKYIVITKNRLREEYYLCEIKNNKLVEIAKSDTPIKLGKRVAAKEKWE